MDILVDPNLAYLFLLVGTLLGLLALVTPGTGALEIGALFGLVLAGFAMMQNSFNLWALIVLAASVAPFFYAIRGPRRELFLGLSILGLVVGSVFLFRSDGGGPAVNWMLALAASAFYAGFLWIAIRKAMQAHLTRPTHDLGTLIGQVGEAKTRIHEDGSVQVAGELWSARSKNPIGTGKQVRVTGRDGFILEVEAESEK
ncbi:MAG: NfeD family protein [Chloroflexota bacterium]